MLPIRLLFLLALGILIALGAAPRRVPPIVFVARGALPRNVPPGVPGLGPLHRTAVTKGRLMVRWEDGRIRPLIQDEPMLDVSDPCVSWDGKRVVFAGVLSPDTPWRIFVVNADGTGIKAVSLTDRQLDLASLGANAQRFERYDDFDPCWLPDGRICFASTRYPQVAETGDLVTSNLYVTHPDTGGMVRISTERNGAEEPTVDAQTGRIVYARWWFNRYLPSEADSSGITLEGAKAVPSDSVDLWHPISITPTGDGGRLAGGNPRVRAETMAYQPVVLADGTLIGVQGERASLFPSPGRLDVLIFRRRFAPPIRLEKPPEASACSPTVLPDGRLLVSYDPTGAGDYGLYTAGADGKGIEKLLDLPESLELDAVALAPRKTPPVVSELLIEDFPRRLPVVRETELKDSVTTFRFDCLNVFTNAPVDAPFPDAPPFEQGLRIRFYAALSRPGVQGGDTVILLRETPVDRSGAVHEHELPADTPMFEQLIDAHGRILRSVTGPAHVPGFNSGRFGHGTKCVGCHMGHSAIPVASSAGEGKRFNASPSAEVTASSVAEGTAGLRAAVDRRAKGPAGQVAWVAKGATAEHVRLSWKRPIAVDSLVLYAISPQSSEGTDLKIQELEVVFFQGDREVRREALKREVVPSGTRIACQGVRADAIEVRPMRFTGRVHHRAAVGLAEIETLARLTED